MSFTMAISLSLIFGLIGAIGMIVQGAPKKNFLKGDLGISTILVVVLQRPNQIKQLAAP